MPKQKSKPAANQKREEGTGETVAFTIPCQFCGGEAFTVREYGSLGKLAAVCHNCQGTEAVTFLDV